MKVPVEWLREYLDTPLADDALADRMTMAGLEVEEITGDGLDKVFHTKVTPNRGDWMSVVGSAREAAAAADAVLTWQTPLSDDAGIPMEAHAGVDVADAKLCPRFALKVIRDVVIGPSPTWMQRRLIAAGMRPLNVVVDITNYVMLELGQPLHAYDYDLVPEGRIVVRRATRDEKITTLDGIERSLNAEMLLICDKTRPIGIAGIMGGGETEVSDRTRHILLESAHFDPGSIRRTAKALGLSTEASYRFERNVDPELTGIALDRATALLAELAGGHVVPGRIDHYPVPRMPQSIALRTDRTNDVLGTNLSADEIAACLSRLDLAAERTDTKTMDLLVTVPTFRPDLVEEIDLIEEVGRMTGYENLPETLPPARSAEGGRDSSIALFRAQVATLMAGYGFREALTNSLVAPSPFDDPFAEHRRVRIRQALSAELSAVRASLVPNLLQVAAANLRHRHTEIKLFEAGSVFYRGPVRSSYVQEGRLGAVMTGPASPRSWSKQSSDPVDFFYAKGIVESLAASLRLPDLTWRAEQRPHMHPGRCAAVLVNEVCLGYVAEVDSESARSCLDVPAATGRIAVFELYLPEIRDMATSVTVFRSLPRYPAVSRDLAIVVDANVPYAEIVSAGRSGADAGVLEDFSLVSVYTGERVAPGKKSVALRMVFRAEDRTLTDAEVDREVAAVEKALVRSLGAERR